MKLRDAYEMLIRDVEQALAADAIGAGQQYALQDSVRYARELLAQRDPEVADAFDKLIAFARANIEDPDDDGLGAACATAEDYVVNTLGDD